MKAMVQDRFGSADVLRVEETPLPAVADDRVLVRVRAASINAKDWRLMHGDPAVGRVAFGMGLRRPSQRVQGGDLAGVVSAVGKDSSRFTPGDEVFGTGSATFAEYAVASERSLAPKPAQLSFVEASAVGIAGTTALQGLRDHGHLATGQRVLVNGAGGGVGTFAVQIAKALGAHVTAATRPKTVDLARSLGADEVIDTAREDFTRRPERYDLILDISSDRPLLATARVLAPGGALVIIGGARGGLLGPLPRIVSSRLARRLVTGRMAFGMARITQDDLLVLTELIEAGTLRPVVDRVFPLEEAPDAMRYVDEGRARGKVVITMA